MAGKRQPAVAAGLLARPGGAPARTTALEDLPRLTAQQVGDEVEAGKGAPAATPAPSGIKGATIGLTVYLLPREHKRVRRLAIDMDVPSVHELLLLGLDRLLAERGEQPIQRYSPPRPIKGIR